MFGECRIRPADLWHAKVMLYHCATPQLYNIVMFFKIYFGKPIIDDSVAGNVQGFKNFKIWPFLQILSFKLFLIAYTSSLCHIEAPHIVRNWPNFSWIQFDILDMVVYMTCQNLGGALKGINTKMEKSVVP